MLSSVNLYWGQAEGEWRNHSKRQPKPRQSGRCSATSASMEVRSRRLKAFTRSIFNTHLEGSRATASLIVWDAASQPPRTATPSWWGASLLTILSLRERTKHLDTNLLSMYLCENLNGWLCWWFTLFPRILILARNLRQCKGGSVDDLCFFLEFWFCREIYGNKSEWGFHKCSTGGRSPFYESIL